MNKAILIVTNVLNDFVATVGSALLSAVPVWILWNVVIPPIFELPQISLIQAAGLSTLCSILFKSSPSSSSED